MKKKNKGIIHQLLEKNEYKEVQNNDITIEDIRQWKKELDEAGIPERKIKLMKYCSHRKEVVQMNIPMEEGDCELCHSQTWGEILEDTMNEKVREAWFDPQVAKMYDDFEKGRQQQFKKDCEDGKV